MQAIALHPSGIPHYKLLQIKFSEITAIRNKKTKLVIVKWLYIFKCRAISMI